MQSKLLQFLVLVQVCAHSPGCGGQVLWWRNAIWVTCGFCFLRKVVWCWYMNEVEKPKVSFFGWKNTFNHSGRDLKLLRSCVFNWTWEWEGKTLIRDFIHWWIMFFKVLFYLQYGLRKWQSLIRLQRKATAVSVLIYWILNPTVGGRAKGDTA